VSRPTCFAVDIETFGALKNQPEQRVFAAQKYKSVHGVDPRNAIITASITFPELDPRASKDEPWTLELIRKLRPGDTMVFDLTDMRQRERFGRWLEYADTLFTVNGGFDIGNLRYCFNWQNVLHDQTIIDGIVLNFQYSEVRPEKSLKAFGVLSGLYSYDQTIKQQRFNTVREVLKYNAEDTHNTLLMCATVAADIVDRLPKPQTSKKMNPFMIQHYSDLLWECVLKTEAGIPHDIRKLLAVARKNYGRIVEIADELEKNHGLQIAGTGSQASQKEFIKDVIDTLTEMGENPTTHELFQLTKKKEISTGVQNRNLFRLLLPSDHKFQRPLELWQEHGTLHKVFSSYAHTRIWCRSNKHSDVSSRVIPVDRDFVFPPMPEKGIKTAAGMKVPPLRKGTSTIGLCHPTWYMVPSAVKDGAGSEGGTIQGRPIAKNPAAQTDPPAIQATKMSRWPGGMIVHYDLSQIELRIAGILSGDKSLHDAYHNGEDLHGGLAIACEGPSVVDNPHFGHGDRQLDPRQWYKQANFLICYRGGWMTLLINILKNCNRIQTKEFAQNTIDALKQARHGLWSWQDELIAKAKKDKRVDLPIIGMSRYFMGGDKFEENEICNFPVQTWAGTIQNRVEILNGKYLNSRTQRYPRILPIINIYDAIEYDVKDEKELAIADEMMDNTIKTMAESDIYGQLCDLTGNHIPLEYSREVIGHNTY